MRPAAIFRFGSHARGEAGWDTDLDFLVAVAAWSRTRYKRSVEARRVRGET